MSDMTPLEMREVTPSELALNRFEAEWLAWREGESLPRWQDHLPAEEKLCTPDLIFNLLQLDIECRIKAGLPAVLGEAYFAHPRLQRDDARLDAERQVQLIRWEYQQRWQKGASVRRGQYEAAFPQHAAALRDLKPQSRCPRCRKILVVEETVRTLVCPDCGSDSAEYAIPPLVADLMPARTMLADLDPRRYELIEHVNKGGQGEIWRCCDPALDRDLAIKVMLAEYRGNEEYERRFIREARITASLQHPGIVPVHNLGRLADGRLHYTMRLLRGGKTLAGILKEETSKPERLPYLLGIFERICQAVAYAHSKRVIHRDLKPLNVMVGRFGEVQVLDWGLAKVLTPDDVTHQAEESLDVSGTRMPRESADTPVDLSRTGYGFGTLPYMPSEQARGKWDSVDERADVFALGSILCEILTGQPAYLGTSSDLLDRVERGDVAEALQRLQQCGADAALTELCRACLSPQREARPRDAGVLADRVAAYQSELRERLRQAELERVAAETRAREEQARALVEQERTREALARAAAEAERAQEAQARARAERRSRRRLLALAAALLVLIGGGGAAAWWMHQVRMADQARQDQADREAMAALESARERMEEGWRGNDPAMLTEAMAEGKRAADIARNGGARPAVIEQAAALQTEVQQQLQRAQDNKLLLTTLLDIAAPHETQASATSSGPVKTMAEPSVKEQRVEEQYAAAFRRRWPDLDIEKQSATAVAARLQQEPQMVVQGVIAGLDAWMVERRRQRSAEAEWRRLLAVVERLDPSESGRKLRALLIGAVPPSPATVVGLFAGPPSWPALGLLVRGNAWRSLRQLRQQMNVANEPVLTVLLLAQTSAAVGDRPGAEEVLRRALIHRPGEVVLLDALGKLLQRQGRLMEAIGWYRAARARDSGLGVALSQALVQAGQAWEGEALLRDLIAPQPANPELFYYLGSTLQAQKKYAQAENAYGKAIELKPDYALAYNNLSIALRDQGKLQEAESAALHALKLQPDLAQAYNNLGNVLGDQEKYKEAEAAYLKAIALDANLALVYYNLGWIRNEQGKYAEAETSCRMATQLLPNYPQGYYTLGWSLNGQGKYAEAELACRRAIALVPNSNYPAAYSSLGWALNDQGKHAEAEAACRKAIQLAPDFAWGYINLGRALRDQGRFAESLTAFQKGHELGSKEAGWHDPSLQRVRDVQRLVALEKELPRILEGETSPANAKDGITLAWLCQQSYKKLYAASARLYADVFRSQPQLALDLKRQLRYDAACSAALAAVGQGEDARLLPDKVATMFRRWALSWLRDDLTAYARLAERNNPMTNQMIQQRLTHWRRDPDLVSLRDPSGLDRLSDNERTAWQTLWRDVDELAKRVAAQKKSKP